MIYLYAGLGIAMISGISAMMQIGVNLIAIERLFPLKDKTYNEYYLRLDQQIMKILYTPSVPVVSDKAPTLTKALSSGLPLGSLITPDISPYSQVGVTVIFSKVLSKLGK